MRSAWVLCAWLLTACSTQTVHCERHLTPINVPPRPVAGAPAHPHAKVASAQSGGGKASPAGAGEGTP